MCSGDRTSESVRDQLQNDTDNGDANIPHILPSPQLGQTTDKPHYVK